MCCCLPLLVSGGGPPTDRVSFMGENLTNHSYVDLTLVGTDTSDPGNTVRCHTDLPTHCTNVQIKHRGDWYFPNGTRLHLVMLFLRIALLSELTYFKETALAPHHLVYITAILLMAMTTEQSAM